MSRLSGGVAVTPNIRLVRQLGRGGMGSVWLAEHAALRTSVVVKFMAQHLAAEPESVARFSREAAAAAKVRSPHVVQIFDHGVTSDGTPFIVMELLEGHDLGEHLEAVGRMTPSAVGRMIAQVGKALARAHAVGIVHRDIKPENIFLCDMGEGEIFVKLLDFGLAKRREEAMTSETKTGITMGTPFYMSPEQIVSPKLADFRADLWALAVVTFEALTGRRPFEGETIGAVAVALHNPNLPIPSKVLPGLPLEVDAWFKKACAMVPGDRFPSALELSDALRVAVQAPPTQVLAAPPPFVPTRAPRSLSGPQQRQETPAAKAPSSADAIDKDVPPEDWLAIDRAPPVVAPEPAPTPATAPAPAPVPAPVPTGEVALFGTPAARMRRNLWMGGAALLVLVVGLVVVARSGGEKPSTPSHPASSFGLGTVPPPPPHIENSPPIETATATAAATAPPVAVAGALHPTTAAKPSSSSSSTDAAPPKPSVSAAVKKKYVDIK